MPSVSPVQLTSYLRPGSVWLDVDAADKAALLRAVADCLAAAGPPLDPQTVADLLTARERLASTGVGHGVAIPHASVATIETPRLCLLRVRAAIDFDAIDAAPVRLVVGVLAPPNAQALHLRLLARVARLVQAPLMREALLAAHSADDAYSLIDAADSGRAPEPVHGA